MHRIAKTMLNLLLTAGLLFWLWYPGCLSLSAEAAFERSERTYHYGPSHIVGEMTVGNELYRFGIYKSWYSCTVLQKRGGLLWEIVGQSVSDETDTALPISWTYDKADTAYLFFGIRQDPAVTRIVLKNAEGEREIRTFQDDFFWLVEKVPFSVQYVELYGEEGQLLYRLDSQQRLMELSGDGL